MQIVKFPLTTFWIIVSYVQCWTLDYIDPDLDYIYPDLDYIS